MLTDFAEIWWLVCNLTSQCWRRISLKSDVVCQSYGKVYRGAVFSWTRCRIVLLGSYSQSGSSWSWQHIEIHKCPSIINMQHFWMSTTKTCIFVHYLDSVRVCISSAVSCSSRTLSSHCAETTPAKQACDDDAARRLWDESFRLLQLTADELQTLPLTT